MAVLTKSSVSCILQLCDTSQTYGNPCRFCHHGRQPDFRDVLYQWHVYVQNRSIQTIHCFFLSYDFVLHYGNEIPSFVYVSF
jgi:hypothetical protein